MNTCKIAILLLLFTQIPANAADLIEADQIVQKKSILLSQNLSNEISEKLQHDRRKSTQDVDKRSPENSGMNSQQQSSDTGLTVCAGEFALCASSTCAPTGRLIKVKENGGKTTREYKESACKCPVITAEIAQQNGTALTALAAVNEGNMNGSCTNSGPDKVWAIYSPKIYEYPQESTTPPFRMAMANRQICPAGSIGSNCWNFECTIDKEKTNGAKTATCFCAINEGQFGYRVAPRDTLVTAAGGYLNPPSQACNMYPANGWGRPIGLIDSNKLVQ